MFCSLCQKWVQLRQDSSYCAYPWLQHRGKCLARQYVFSNFPRPHSRANVPTFPSQRRVQKAAEAADSRSRKHGMPDEEDELMSENDAGSDGPESEEGIDSHAEEDRFRRKDSRRMERHHHNKDLQRGNGKARMRSAYHYPSQTRHSLGGTSAYRHSGSAYPQRMVTTRPWDDDMDGDGDVDADGDSYIEEERPLYRAANRGHIRRPWPAGLADLDSPAGR